MIDDRLDELARRMAGSEGALPRSSMFRRLAAAFVGGGAAVVALSEADTANAATVCPKGLKACKGLCRDINIDPDNCGRCGKVCSANQLCRKGKCVAIPCTCTPRCAEGLTTCGGTCVDLATDHANCGTCGRSCSGNQVCVNGVCQAGGAVCGNGVIEAGEQCDGANLGGQTCVGLGFAGGTLACTNACMFDTSACTGACSTPADCPGTDTVCSTRTCVGGHCGATFAVAGTPGDTQTAGDCKRVVCDGAGGFTTVNDDTDVPSSGNPCVTPVCVNGTPSFPPVADGTICPGGTCMAGVCTP
jgi:hypothetical protein